MPCQSRAVLSTEDVRQEPVPFLLLESVCKHRARAGGLFSISTLAALSPFGNIGNDAVIHNRIDAEPRNPLSGALGKRSRPLSSASANATAA